MGPERLELETASLRIWPSAAFARNMSSASSNCLITAKLIEKAAAERRNFGSALFKFLIYLALGVVARQIGRKVGGLPQ